MANTRFAVDIVSNDKTASGINSAQKRLSRLPKAANDAGKSIERLGAKSQLGGLRSVVNTMGAVEKATSRAFGGSSPIAAAVSRMGALGEAGAAVGTGLGDAAAGAGLLGAGLGVVGIAAGATVAVLGAAAFAAYKLADGWAANVAGLGRLSASIGIATKDIQEFQGAGERAGVSKGDTAAGLSGIARTVHDARYGRNQEAAATMARLGIKLNQKADGSYDYTQATLDIADAIKRQKDPQSQALIAEKFGAASALPLLRQGSGAIRADMADVSRHGVEVDDAGVAKATGFVRSKAILSQLGERQKSKLGEASAGPVAASMDGLANAGRALIDGNTNFGDTVKQTFAPAAAAIERGAAVFAKAAEKLAVKVVGVAMTEARDPLALAKQTERLTGIPAALTLAQYELESGHGKHMPIGSNNPFGIKAKPGEPFVTAMTNEFNRQTGRTDRVPQNFRKFDSLQDAFDAHARLLASGKRYAGFREHLDDPEAAADALTGVYATDPNYGRKLKSQMRADAHKIELTHRFEGLPDGAKVKTTRSGSSEVAIGQGFPATVF